MKGNKTYHCSLTIEKREREGKEINHLGSPTVQITTPKLVNMQEISFNTFSFDAKAKKSPSIKSI
jgi:hypothetical protein